MWKLISSQSMPESNAHKPVGDNFSAKIPRLWLLFVLDPKVLCRLSSLLVYIFLVLTLRWLVVEVPFVS